MNKYQKGITLVELLVSMTISVIVIGSSITTYVGVKKIYQNINQQANDNVKALMVKQAFENILSNMGFACVYGSQNQSFEDNTGDNMLSILEKGVASVGNMPFPNDYGLPGSMEGDCSGECFQIGTDYLMIQRDTEYTNTVSDSSGLVFTVPKNSIKELASDEYIITCTANAYNLMKISDISTNGEETSITISNNIDSSIGKGGYVGKYELDIYYIRDTGRLDKLGNKIYSLYLYIRDSSSRGMSYELIDGVSNLKIAYVKTEDVSQGSNINWSSISSATRLDKNVSGLKLSFDINGQTYNRIIPINVN
ncbi:PilW family protein [Pseudofrancisella aestuarii]|uniref:PilW family protein n=1 Tax=Pseudofrancisella aestuarii TaxID=2670347 RepID=A0ABV9TB75_9GAMM|nr:prepilin-type N-terminal cleavage/methylation domain-containing protein [Pseudofrancisella aestuarii]